MKPKCCSQASGFSIGHPGFYILFIHTLLPGSWLALSDRAQLRIIEIGSEPPPTKYIIYRHSPIFHSLLTILMEAIFDNKANVLNAQLHAPHDNSVIYDISTSQSLWRRTYTYLRDTNPALGGESVIVGAINWRKKTFEIQGQRKSIKDIRRKPKGLFKK